MSTHDRPAIASSESRGIWARFQGLVGSDVFPGLLLFAATTAALAIANSRAADTYGQILSIPFTVGFAEANLAKPLILWINDGLMAVFFLLVGLEIKRELKSGELSTLRQAALPMFAAVGGMLVPAVLYLVVNQGAPGARGWGIPMATDIAFALGVLAVLGSRVPLALKVFLTAVAVVDDLGAVLVIALFYTETLYLPALAVAGAVLVGLVALNRLGVARLAPYLLLGAILWVAVLKSGIHATVAGVLLALTIPWLGRHAEAPLIQLEHRLQPWVMFLIVPIFAFANAGVDLGGAGGGQEGAPSLVFWGVIAGLLVGKPVGVLGMSWLAVRMGWADRPAGVGWMQLAAVAMLTGIGFTMSLFVGQLAFGPGAQLEAAKLGILAASAVSAVGGLSLLILASRGTARDRGRATRGVVASEGVPEAA
jgi:NhaA family Na+:H+ antiporter